MVFNGNGKLDLMLVYQSPFNTDIIEYNNTSNVLANIYNQGFPTIWHQDLQTGDFNGDGNTDLLYYTNNKWMIGYSTGNGSLGFEEHDASAKWFLHNNHNGNGITRMSFSVLDANGDGKSDIIERIAHWNNSSINQIHVYFSTGSGFVKEYIGSNHIEKNHPITFTNMYIGDFNGDGKQDITLLGEGISVGIHVPFIGEHFHQYHPILQKISVGTHTEYSFKWSTLPNSKHYKKTNLQISGQALVLHAKNITIPMVILEELTTKIGTRTFKTNYYFNNLLYHLHGRGLMGFQKTAVVKWHDQANKRTTVIQHFKQNAAYAHVLNLEKSETYKTSTPDNAGFITGQQLLAKTSYQYTQVRTSLSNPEVYFMYPSITIAYDYVQDFVNETCFKYDRFGNLTLQRTNHYYLNNYPAQSYFQTSTTFKYNKKGLQWIPGSCIQKEEVAIKTGLQGHHYTKVTYDYNARGNLFYTQSFKGDNLYELSTTLAMDKYGNISSKTTANAQQQTRAETYTYGQSGRFMATETNVLGQTKTFSFDPNFGGLLEVQGYDGIVSSKTFNRWGELSSETHHGLTQLHVKTFTNLYGAFIKYTTTDALGISNVAYMDAAGNKVRTESVGFNGQIQVQEFNFNSDNQLISQSNIFDPQQSSATKRLTEYTYDELNRMTVVKYHGVNTMYKSYDKNKVINTPLKGTSNILHSNSETSIDPLGNTILVSDLGGQISYEYGHHNKMISTTCNGATTLIEYNPQLNKSRLVEPNSGFTNYLYDAWGQLIEQTDAKGNSFTYTYDGAGRLINKADLSGNEYIYTYYPTPSTAHGEVNQLKKEELKVNGVLAHSRLFDYFPNGLLKECKEMGANNQAYTTSYAYDAFMRLTEAHYPNISLSYGYNNHNDLITLTDVETNTVLWQKTQEAVDGRPVENTYGNGFINQQSYDNWLQLAMIKSTKPGNPNQVAFHQNYNFELGSNNLLSRTTVGVGTETFGYDNLNRLTSISEIIGSTITPKTFLYEGNGNLTSQQIGTIQTLQYNSDGPHAISDHRFTLNQPVPTSSAEEHSYVYNDFNSISEISQSTLSSATAQPRTIQITYGVDQQRIKMAYASPTSAYASTTFYIGSANMELRGDAEFTYLYDGYGAPFAIQRKTGETKELFYLHLDHLGSLMAISDEQGNIIEKRSYDAWGRHRHPTTWSYTVHNPFGMGGSNDITLRGYTFHEHLQHFSLINMNGRLYDYVLGRMLSPDNYVQSPNSSQSFNRYSYCWNNPLKYTDPSGEFVVIDSWIVGFVHGFTSTGSERWSSGWSEANLRAGNDAKIWGGLFVSDPNKGTGERIWEVFSRFTWQLPQTIGGFMTAQSVNTFGLFGGVSQVDYAYGATAVTTRSGKWGAVAQGSFIVGNNTLRADANNSLFQHEYGHYLQSQSMGWAYYPRVGIPSSRSKGEHDFHPVEQDANRRAFIYFNKNVDDFYVSEEDFDKGVDRGWDFWRNPLNVDGSKERDQFIDFKDTNHLSSLDGIRVRAKWYDHASWLLLPIGGPIWMGLINSNKYNR